MKTKTKYLVTADKWAAVTAQWKGQGKGFGASDEARNLYYMASTVDFTVENRILGMGFYVVDPRQGEMMGPFFMRQSAGVFLKKLPTSGAEAYKQLLTEQRDASQKAVARACKANFIRLTDKFLKLWNAAD